MIILNRANDLRNDILYIALGGDGLRSCCDSRDGFGVLFGEAIFLGKRDCLHAYDLALGPATYCGGLRDAAIVRERRLVGRAEFGLRFRHFADLESGRDRVFSYVVPAFRSYGSGRIRGREPAS